LASKTSAAFTREANTGDFVENDEGEKGFAPRPKNLLGEGKAEKSFLKEVQG
jgi:hypothetical protein